MRITEGRTQKETKAVQFIIFSLSVPFTQSKDQVPWRPGYQASGQVSSSSSVNGMIYDSGFAM